MGTHGRRTQALVASLALVIGGAVAFALPAGAAVLSASGRVTSPTEYVGHPGGIARSLVVSNTGGTRITSVTVDRPSSVWVVTSCSSGGSWLATRTATGCRWTSSAGLAPHSGRGFAFAAGTSAQTHDQGGSWKLHVGDASGTATGTATAAHALDAHAYSIELTRVAALLTAPVVGSACPSPARSAKAGGRTTLVVCGTNHTTSTFSASPTRSKQLGTFASRGSWAYSSLHAGARGVFANKLSALVTSVAGPGKTVVVSLRSTGLTQTSPLVTFGGFTAADKAPTTPGASATSPEDGSTPVTLTGVDADGDATGFSVVSGPAHGSLGTLSAPVCAGAAPKTCTTSATYTPAADFNGSDSFTYRVTDPFGLTATGTAALTVTPVNDAPTDISLSASTVSENQPSGTVVGTLTDTDVDTGDTAAYSLVSGTGSTDNGSFTISGNQLKTAAGLDYESTPSLSVRVRVTDSGGGTFEKAFTITVTNADDAPTDITLSNGSVAENLASGATVGLLSTTDADAGDTFTYSLVSGTGSTDNARFAIAGNQLQTAATLDFEAKSSYSVRIRTTDAGGKTFEKAFTVTVTDVNDAPTAPALTSTSVAENQPVGTTVGTLSSTDQDGDPLTYSIVAGGDGASFTISGTSLKTAAVFDYETKSSYSVTVQVSDGNGGTATKAFTITVTDGNDVPTAIALSSSTVPENAASGTTVGTLSDTDADTGDTPTYSLVAGTGSTDNGSFTIVGSTLKTAAAFDFESKSSYSVRVKVDDGHGGTFEQVFAITVTDVNEAPTDLSLSNSAFVEHAATGTVVGTLSTTDQDAGDTFTYALVAGTGSTDNASFSVTGNQLKVAADLAQGSYTVRLSTTDSGALSFSKAFAITVNAANSAPTDISLSNSMVDENQPAGTTVGTLSDTDTDPGDTPTFSVTGGADAASFTVSGTSLQTAAPLDYETKQTYSVQVTVNDGHGGTFAKTFTITAVDKDDAPTDVALVPSSVAENSPSGTTVGALSTTDQDAGDSFSYTLVAGTGSTDNGSFTITGSTLKTAASFDFEAKSSYAIRVQTQDAGGKTFQKALTVTVTNVNDAPTDLALSPSSVAENSPSGTTVGALSTTDQDAGDSFTYTLVAGTGSTDNGSFTITGSTLKTAASFDVEAKSSYAIRVQTQDATGSTFQKALVVTVTNVNESPTDLALSPSSIAEDQPSGTTVGTLSSTDPDAGDTFTYTLVAGTGSTDNASFTITGSTLKTATALDFETKPSYAIRVQSQDATGSTFQKQLTVTVTNVNESPTDIALSPSSVPENSPSSTTVGTLSSTDPDAGDTFTYTLVAGTGSTDNASFTITGSALKTAASFDFETKSSYAIRVQSQDAGGKTFQKALTVTVTDVNEAPTAGTDAYNDANGNSDAIGNTKLAVGVPAAAGPAKYVSGSVLTNDTDPEGNSLTASFPSTSAHGTILTGNTNGSFVYLPDAGYTGADTFSYTVSDGSLTAAGSVSIVVANPVWYADDSAPSGGTGQSTSPFSTAAALNPASSAGDTLFLYDGTYPGGLALKSSQQLLTQRAGLTVDGTALVTAVGGATENLKGGLVLASGNTVQGLDLGDASGYALSGASVGTTVVDTTTPGLINNTTGGGIGITGTGNALTMTFSSVTSTNSAADGISILNASGTVNVGGGAITNATGNDVLLDGGTLTLNDAATVTDDVGQLVKVVNKTGGTATFSAFIDDGGDGDGSGVTLTSNGGSTVAFTGGLRLATGANPAFTATGGGTVIATQNNTSVVNTLLTTTGTALNIASTTIGGAGLTFRSIGSSGAVSGIVLSSTGAGALSVVGNGSAATGGTITGSTGAGIALTSVAGGVNLNRMVITNGQDDGIRAATVTALAVADSSITGNGNAAGEDGVDATQLSGVSSLTNDTITTSADKNVSLVNTSGTATLNVTNGSITGSGTGISDDGVFASADGGSLTLAVSGTTFSNNRGDHVQMTSGTTSTATESLMVSGTTMTGGATVLGGGIVFNPGGTATMTATGTISNNTINGAVSSAITVATPGSTSSLQPVTVNATISGNIIGTAGTTDSGSSQGDGINVSAHGGAKVHATVVSNTVRQYSNLAGIRLVASDGSGTLDAKVQGNTIANPGTFATNGINAAVGSSVSTDSFVGCLDIGGAGGLVNTVNGSGAGGGTDIRVRQLAVTTFKLVGYGGANNDNAAVASYLTGRNAAAPTASATNNVAGGGGGFTTAASCVVP